MQNARHYSKIESLKPIPDTRKHKRVRVRLKGALRIPNVGVEVIHTNNISEGGVSLSIKNIGPLEIGSKVQLHLNGIVSNEESKRLTTYEMQVAHINGSILGLHFV